MDKYHYDYAVIRIVPKVEREEFINTGVIVSCEEKKFLKTRIEMDARRLKTLDPEFDIETAKSHLTFIDAVCEGNEIAGEIGKLSQRQRFHWLTSPKSTIIQISQVHSGYCKDPYEVLEHIFKVMVS